MDLNNFTLFLKMVEQEYRLSATELTTLKSRLLADEREFDRAWKLFRTRARGSVGGQDPFGVLLRDLLF